MAGTGKALDWLVADALGGAAPLADAARGGGTVPAGPAGSSSCRTSRGSAGRSRTRSARGAFVGLTLRHRSARLVRAVLEAAAYTVRRVARPAAQPASRSRELRVTGGPRGEPALEPDQGRRGQRGGDQPGGRGGFGGGRCHPCRDRRRAVDDERAGIDALVSVAERLAPNPAAQAVYDRLAPEYEDLHARLAPVNAAGRRRGAGRAAEPPFGAAPPAARTRSRPVGPTRPPGRRSRILRVGRHRTRSERPRAGPDPDRPEDHPVLNLRPRRRVEPAASSRSSPSPPLPRPLRAAHRRDQPRRPHPGTDPDAVGQSVHRRRPRERCRRQARLLSYGDLVPYVKQICEGRPDPGEVAGVDLITCDAKIDPKTGSRCMKPLSEAGIPGLIQFQGTLSTRRSSARRCPRACPSSPSSSRGSVRRDARRRRRPARRPGRGHRGRDVGQGAMEVYVRRVRVVESATAPRAEPATDGGLPAGLRDRLPDHGRAGRIRSADREDTARDAVAGAPSSRSPGKSRDRRRRDEQRRGARRPRTPDEGAVRREADVWVSGQGGGGEGPRPDPNKRALPRRRRVLPGALRGGRSCRQSWT